jgi:hypothetical protein
MRRRAGSHTWTQLLFTGDKGSLRMDLLVKTYHRWVLGHIEFTFLYVAHQFPPEAEEYSSDLQLVLRSL